jgi:hypothetical protein
MSPPGFGWQDAVVVVVVLATAGWFVRRAILRRRHKGCGCEDCPAKKSLLRAATRPPRPR